MIWSEISLSNRALCIYSIVKYDFFGAVQYLMLQESLRMGSDKHEKEEDGGKSGNSQQELPPKVSAFSLSFCLFLCLSMSLYLFAISIWIRSIDVFSCILLE